MGGWDADADHLLRKDQQIANKNVEGNIKEAFALIQVKAQVWLVTPILLQEVGR